MIIHLLSGGWDSVVMLYDLHVQGLPIYCIMFDYKQKHVQELEFAKLHCRRLNINYTTVELPQICGSALTDGFGTMIVPNRNAVLLSYAVSIAVKLNADSVSYACNRDDADMFPDCRMEFVTAMNEVIKAAGYQINILAPFINKSKWEIVEIGRQLRVSFNETWSCYKGGKEHCGECLACQKRTEALEK